MTSWVKEFIPRVIKAMVGFSTEDQTCILEKSLWLLYGEQIGRGPEKTPVEQLSEKR